MSRRDIHYWKCDRPAAFHGTEERGVAPFDEEDQARQISGALLDHFHADRVDVKSTFSQGIHRTWQAEIDGRAMFLRIDDSPDGLDRLEMESAVLGEVALAGVSVPRVLACDASRLRVPFAWQALERIPFPDLNQWHKDGSLDAETIAFEIGKNVAVWQGIRPSGFGPFDLEAWREGRGLVGLHADYSAYFRLRLESHLRYLVAEGFLVTGQRDEIVRVIEENAGLLEIGQGCLVHKDLALWNVLGSEDRIAAFIDFDDAISGDAMDDLSLLACFHDGVFLKHAFEGYVSKRVLPDDHLRRFWLHLLRNLIVKAVIRVGAGYFERDSGFFLIGSGTSGADLRRFTEERIAIALCGLREGSDLSIL